MPPRLRVWGVFTRAGTKTAMQRLFLQRRSYTTALMQRVRAGDTEAYLCGSLLPSRARASFFAVRALNIEVAGVRDAVRGNAAMGRVRMAFWRSLIAAACAEPSGGSAPADAAATPPPLNQFSAHPLFAPLRDAVAAHGHTRRWLERLVDARDADLEGRAPATVAALEAYLEATQGSLLYLTLEALGVREAGADHAASHVARATGIATLLRSLAVHARLGQQYLPLDLLSKVRAGRAQARARGRARTHARAFSVARMPCTLLRPRDVMLALHITRTLTHTHATPALAPPPARSTG
jgi:phytoene/squalene synthetase